MADKDTPEDAEAPHELVPPPDGPRSEGGPPQRSDTGASHQTPELPPTDPENGPLEDPDNQPDTSWHTAIAAVLTEPASPQPVPQSGEPEHQTAPTEQEAPATDPGGVEETPPNAATVPEPPPEAAPSPEAMTEAEPSPEATPEAEPASEPEPCETHPAAAADPPAASPAPAAPAPAESASSGPADAEAAAFAAAAADLFHPSASNDHEETHLVTLGRRLNPTLSIPRPVAPDIDRRTDEPGAASPPKSWLPGVWKDRLRTGARYAAYAAAGYLALVLVLIVLFRFVNPPGSMLMLTQFLSGTAIDRTWVSFASVSPALVRAVIVSEDSRFCAHSGIDTAAMREAIEQAGRGTPRGASTISMQVTKNLFLWNAKSYVRKVIEIPLTLFMELVWPKQRIIEVYLNIAEWGPGVFGAEAAAQHHFGKSAARLTGREAALLAAALPNPMVRVAGSPGPRTSAKARVIQSRVKAYGSVASCVVTRSASVAAPSPASKSPLNSQKSPQKAQPRATPSKKKQQPADDWTPTLRFGPS